LNPFRCFSLVFSYPTRETLRELGGLRDSAELAGIRCLASLTSVPLEELETEFTRLFISAFPALPCPPYESFYREGVVYGKTTTDVRDIYKSHGFDYVYEGEPPDLLSVELDFLSMIDDSAFLNRFKEWVFEFTKRVKSSSGIYGVCAQELENLLNNWEPLDTLSSESANR
jgi:putative dimethyl sulfoxide reductase chaperone